MNNIYELAANCEKQNQAAALCIITSTKGSTPRKAGAKMLVYENGQIAGTIGGGALEQEIITVALSAIESGRTVLYDQALAAGPNMACGGAVQIYVEPIGQRFELFIFGAGHIGSKLAQQATALNFAVTLIDERKELFAESTANNYKAIAENYNTAFEKLKFTNRTFIASTSHLHEYDRDIVAYCAKQAHAYLGMIGSKRKIATARKIYLEQKILSDAEMDQIDWPMGVAIECQTPDEIVISILAKLIDVRGKLTKAADA